MMKKLLALGLAAAMSLTLLAGCGGDTTGTTSPTGPAGTEGTGSV